MSPRQRHQTIALLTGAIVGCTAKYAKAGDSNRKVGSHVAAFIVTYGPVPDGHEVCHTCDFGLCCNPTHLFSATHAYNMRDAHVKGRMRGGSNPPRGEAHAFAVLTANQVLAIREGSIRSIPQRLMADLCGVSQVSIHKVVMGETWKHVA